MSHFTEPVPDFLRGIRPLLRALFPRRPPVPHHLLPTFLCQTNPFSLSVQDVALAKYIFPLMVRLVIERAISANDGPSFHLFGIVMRSAYDNICRRGMFSVFTASNAEWSDSGQACVTF